MLILEIAAGPDRGEQLRFDDDAAHTLGRFSLQHAWPDPKISRQHAKLQRTARGWTVTDLQSRNGTYVNGSLIHKPTVLHDHDRLRLGRTYFAVTITDTFMFDAASIERPERPQAQSSAAVMELEDEAPEPMQGTAAGEDDQAVAVDLDVADALVDRTSPPPPEPQFLELEEGEPEPAAAQAAAPEVVEPEIAEPEIVESEIAESEIVESEIVESEISQSEVSEPQADDDWLPPIDLQDTPDVPETPDAPDTQDIPDISDAPETPAAPAVLDAILDEPDAVQVEAQASSVPPSIEPDVAPEPPSALDVEPVALEPIAVEPEPITPAPEPEPEPEPEPSAPVAPLEMADLGSVVSGLGWNTIIVADAPPAAEPANLSGLTEFWLTIAPSPLQPSQPAAPPPPALPPAPSAVEVDWADLPELEDVAAVDVPAPQASEPSEPIAPIAPIEPTTFDQTAAPEPGGSALAELDDEIGPLEPITFEQIAEPSTSASAPAAPFVAADGAQPLAEHDRLDRDEADLDEADRVEAVDEQDEVAQAPAAPEPARASPLPVSRSPARIGGSADEAPSLASTLSLAFREGQVAVKPRRAKAKPRRGRRYVAASVLLLLVAAVAFVGWQWYRSVDAKAVRMQQTAGAANARARTAPPPPAQAAPARPIYVPGSRSPVEQTARHTAILSDPAAAVGAPAAAAAAPQNPADRGSDAPLTPDALDTAAALASFHSRTQDQPVRFKTATVRAQPADDVADELTLARPVLDWLGAATMSVPELTQRQAPAPQDFEAIRAQRRNNASAPRDHADPKNKPADSTPAGPQSAAPAPGITPASGITPVPGIAPAPAAATVNAAEVDDSAGLRPQEFNGIRSLQQAHQVVFVIDASGSLLDTLSLVKRQVQHMIGQLRAPQRFTVLFFHDDQVLEPPPAGLRTATDHNKQAVGDWMTTPGNVIPVGRSRPAAALKTAFACEPDQVFLITDSLGNAGEETLNTIAQLNAQRSLPVQVNTVEFLDDRSRDVLQAIARNTGGSFHFISQADLYGSRPSPDTAATGDPMSDSLLMILDGNAPAPTP
jgi:pSer/pThr/pTyr-binding forkhead associated (FHA) protein